MKKIKRTTKISVILIVFLIVASVCIGVSAATTAEVTFSIEGELVQGGSFSIIATLSGCNDVAGLMAELEYDESQIELIGAEWLVDGPLDDSADIVERGENDTFIAFDEDEPVDVNTDVLKVTFKVSESIKLGTQITINCVLTGFDFDQEEIPIKQDAITADLLCPHTNTIEKEQVEPTCKNVGYTAGTYCNDCGKYVSGHVEIPKIDHIFNTEWLNDDTYHWHKCKNCDTISAKQLHRWNGGAVTVSPTVDSVGERLYTCLDCSATKTETIPKLPSENAPVVSIKSAKGFPGKKVSVDVVIANNPGITHMQLKVEYDSSVLTLESVTDGGILGTNNHPSDAENLKSPYYLTWANNTSANYTANGTIATLHFIVSEEAEVGDYSIRISYDADNNAIINDKTEAVDFAVVDGEVTVFDVLLGDVNSDGKVNALDAMVLGRYIAKWNNININIDASDVNADGKVNSVDGMILARHIAKWVGYDTLPYRN